MPAANGFVQSAARRGIFIVFEGCDRVGKSTQTRLLAEALANKHDQSVKQLHFPDRDRASGQIINDYLRRTRELHDEAVHLLFSFNRWELRDEIVGLLEKGTTVIVDRYAASGAAFSASKRGLDLDWCLSTDNGLPRPDLTVYLRVDPEKISQLAQCRSGFGDERYEEVQFQSQVAKNFDKLKRLADSEKETWVIVDAMAKQEETSSVIEATALDALKRFANGPIVSYARTISVASH